MHRLPCKRRRKSRYCSPRSSSTPWARHPGKEWCQIPVTLVGRSAGCGTAVTDADQAATGGHDKNTHRSQSDEIYHHEGVSAPVSPPGTGAVRSQPLRGSVTSCFRADDIGLEIVLS